VLLLYRQLRTKFGSACPPQTLLGRPAARGAGEDAAGSPGLLWTLLPPGLLTRRNHRREFLAFASSRAAVRAPAV
jgi:hypothetical protein